VPHSSRVSACRRQLHTPSAAQPRTAEHRAQRRASLASVESAPKFVSNLGVGSKNLRRQRVEVYRFKQSQDRSPPCCLGPRFCVGRVGAEGRATLGRCKLLTSAARRGRRPSAALPNPSLKLSPNGGPRGPGRRHVVHSRRPSPRVPPLVPT